MYISTTQISSTSITAETSLLNVLLTSDKESLIIILIKLITAVVKVSPVPIPLVIRPGLQAVSHDGKHRKAGSRPQEKHLCVCN